MRVILSILCFESLNYFYNIIYIFIFNSNFRSEKINGISFKERTDGAYQPYKLSKKINQIENFIWHDCSTIGKCYGAATLRNRFHFLFTLGIVIRSESVFKADLSDLMDFTSHQENNPGSFSYLQRNGKSWFYR